MALAADGVLAGLDEDGDLTVDGVDGAANAALSAEEHELTAWAQSALQLDAARCSLLMGDGLSPRFLGTRRSWV